MALALDNRLQVPCDERIVFENQDTQRHDSSLHGRTRPSSLRVHVRSNPPFATPRATAAYELRGAGGTRHMHAEFRKTYNLSSVWRVKVKGEFSIQLNFN